MILQRLTIDNFAQLDHIEIDLKPGHLNLIAGPNETGKSHVMQALYGTFFGLDSPERFQPWSRPDAEPRATLDLVTDGGSSVRIERCFANQQVTVERDGEVVFQGEVGPRTRVLDAEDYFHCLHDWLGFSDARVFTATTFVQQSDLVRAGMNGLAPQIKTLITGRRNADYERALLEMRRELDEIRTPEGARNPRLLERKRQEMRELEAALSEAQRQRQQVWSLQQRRVELDTHIAEVEIRRERLRGQVARVSRLVEAEASLGRLNAEYREAQSLLDRFVSAHERVEQARLERDRYAAAEGADLVTLLRLEHDVRQAEQQLEVERQRAASESPWTSWIPWIAVLLGVGAGTGLAFLFSKQLVSAGNRLPPHLLVAIAVVVAVFLLLAWVSGLFRGGEDSENDRVSRAQADVATARQERDRLFQELGVATVEETVTLRKTFENADRALERAQASLEALGPEGEANERWQDVRRRLAAVQATVDDVLERDPELRALGTPEARADYAEGVQADVTALESEVGQLRERRSTVARDLLLEEAGDADVPLLVDARDALERQINELEKRSSALEVAIETLEQAVADFHDHALDPVQDQATEVLHTITEGRYTRVHLDPDTLRPTVDSDQREAISSDSLSRGVQDQLYFALRVALAQALSGGRSLPLILDDPYVNLDPDRLARTIELLQALSRHTQVVLFSCNRQYEEWFRPVMRLAGTDGSSTRPVSQGVLDDVAFQIIP